jgi:hypothetical protein
MRTLISTEQNNSTPTDNISGKIPGVRDMTAGTPRNTEETPARSPPKLLRRLSDKLDYFAVWVAF